MTPVPPLAGAGAVAAPELEAARLYECYRQRILAFALRRTRTREDAEDAVQTTFLYAFRSLGRGIVPNHELAWLLTIAQNVCRTRARSASRRGRHEQVADPSTLEAVSSAPPAPGDELASLQQALAGMPARQQRAILLREWQGLSYQEIGDDLGLSQSAVETLLFRARRTLAARLQKALQTLLGPLGLARSLLGGGSAKVAATVVVASGTVVALPPLQRELEHDRLATGQGAAVIQGRSTAVAAAAVGSLLAAPSSQVSERAAARVVTPGKLRRGRLAMPAAGGETVGQPAAAPGGQTPSGPEAAGEPAPPTAGAPTPVGRPGPSAPVVATVSPSKPGASIAANPPGVSVAATVSTGELTSAAPTVDTNVSITTPAGSGEVAATVSPGAPDPVAVNTSVAPPPLPALPPPPPILP